LLIVIWLLFPWNETEREIPVFDANCGFTDRNYISKDTVQIQILCSFLDRLLIDLFRALCKRQQHRIETASVYVSRNALAAGPDRLACGGRKKLGSTIPRDV